MYWLTTGWLLASLSATGDAVMNALAKQKVKAPTRPTGKKPSASEMFERVMERFPKTMARLAE